MDLHTLLWPQADEIAAEALDSLCRARLEHYRRDETERLRERLLRLIHLTIECAATKRARSMLEFADRLARERYAAGYDLSEVQTAFNVVEEAIWKRVLDAVEPGELAEALGLVGTVLGLGKDTLARTWVSLASSARAPSLDLKAMFAGTDGD